MGTRRHVGARIDILASDAEQRSLPIIIDGWACRYRILANGKRQLISLFLPGDMCEPFGILPRFTEHPLGALTDVAFAPAPLRAIQEAVRSSRRIEEAMWWDLLVSSAVEREHIVSLGRRSGAERVGHLLCELQLRLAMVGLVDGIGYDLPMTQPEIGDLVGLSAVHVNRSLQDLRKSGLISFRGRRLVIHDLDRLRDLAFFDPGYLHVVS